MFQTIPVKRQARWRLMNSIIQEWLRPLTAADGFPPDELDQVEARLGCKLPRALREWYQLAGHARDIWSRQDRLVLPVIDREVLVFCVESQAIWSMGVRMSDLGRADPPVVGWMNEHYETSSEFGQLNSSVSESALQYLAWSMKWANANPRFACHLSTDYYGYGSWTPATLSAIEHHCVRCAFPTWRLWARDTVFYQSQDVLIEVGRPDAGGGDPGLSVSVRTKEALANFERWARGTGFRWASDQWYTS